MRARLKQAHAVHFYKCVGRFGTFIVPPTILFFVEADRFCKHMVYIQIHNMEHDKMKVT